MTMDDSARPTGRLDSWKAIAAYLQRDVRTVRRWESTLGLPVRRVSSARGASVFAYQSEIDAWLKEPRAAGRNERTSAEHGPPDPPAEGIGASPQPTARPAILNRGLLVTAAGVAAALLVIAIAVWYAVPMAAVDVPLQLELTPTGFIARDGDGSERWRVGFPPGDRGVIVPRGGRGVVDEQDERFVAAVSYFEHGEEETARSGEILSLTDEGAVERRFAFDDNLAFNNDRYARPWAIVDYRVNTDVPDRPVAVVAHHYTWWPSIVTVLDREWRRRGTFVHAGWVERLHWLNRDNLLIVGFSQPLDGGMLAVLDVNTLNGQTPVDPESRYYCPSCGDGRPVKYVVMPRTEVNRAAAARFNRAVLQVMEDRLLARTIEIENAVEGLAADVLYEFSPSLELLRAEFSERYWDQHRALEMQGKLDHPRERCPDRDGPRLIHVWEPTAGWIRVTPP